MHKLGDKTLPDSPHPDLALVPLSRLPSPSLKQLNQHISHGYETNRSDTYYI